NRSGSCQAGDNRLWPPPICQLETRARQSVEREKRTMIAGASLGFLDKALFPRALFFELGLRRCSTDENEPALAAFDDRPFGISVFGRGCLRARRPTQGAGAIKDMWHNNRSCLQHFYCYRRKAKLSQYRSSWREILRRKHKNG